MEKGIARFRAIWLSDLHLGTRSSRAESLLGFLKEYDADTFYLAGDIFDGWAMKRSWYWNQYHNDVVQKLLRKARKGARIIYIPGNHDEMAGQFAGLFFGGIEVRPQVVHETADGRRFLVIHGHEFDGVVKGARWLQQLGSAAYDWLVLANQYCNRLRLLMGYPYWSLSAYIKRKTKRTLQYIDDFETLVVRRAQQEKLDGIVCGHIHQACLRVIEGVTYANSGDWVESCTALVEHYHGELEIIHWRDPEPERAKRKAASELVAEEA
jgi:UDP-2,3-diacylglucosamine pyrophosphatase LpxH